MGTTTAYSNHGNVNHDFICLRTMLHSHSHHCAHHIMWCVCVCLQVNWQQERFQEIISKLGHFLKQAGFKVMQSVHMEDVYIFFPCAFRTLVIPPQLFCVTFI